jgi:hypothetical protein
VIENLVFLSYSRKDAVAARELYGRLKEAGYTLWFDEEDLLPGQVWEVVIEQVIRKCAAVVMCLSSKWIGERSYIQKELKIVIEVLGEMPAGRIFVIPVKLDECEVPLALAKTHWIGLSETRGFERIQKAINSAIGTATAPPASPGSSSPSSPNPWHDWLEDTIAKGHLIHDDPWASSHSKEELEFKGILKGRWNTGFDLLSALNHEGIIKLWRPLLENPFFRVEHPEWQDKPYFRCQIHTAKCQLFYAHVQLGQAGDFEQHVPAAFALLKEILLGNPYSLKGASHDRLSTESARTQNLNYQDTLNFALDWYSGWETYLGMLNKATAEDVQRVKRQVINRLGEIQFMLRQDPEKVD